MSDIIAEAVRAGCKALDKAVGIKADCVHPSCECAKKAVVLAALRAVCPRNPPFEEVDAMDSASCQRTCTLPECANRCHWSDEANRSDMLAAYRAGRLWRALWGEEQ